MIPVANPFLNIFLPSLPAMVAWLVGLGIALVTWRRHPQVSLLVVIIVVLFILDVIASAWINARLPFALRTPGRAGLALAGLSSGLQALLGGGIVVLVLAAIFGWRQERP